VLLVTHPCHCDQPAFLQPLQLPLHRAGPAPGQPDDLGGEKAALRLAEQQAQHALLRLGKQRIGQTGARRRYGGLRGCSLGGGLYTHFGYRNTLFG
jgi:hypothetical protein